MVNKHGALMRDFFSTNMAVQIFYKMVLAFVFKNYENTKAHIDWPDPENHCFYKKNLVLLQNTCLHHTDFCTKSIHTGLVPLLFCRGNFTRFLYVPVKQACRLA